MSCGGAYAPRQSAPSRRIGGAGDHRRDGATATLAKHALVAECDECFFDECSRKEKLLLHRILRPTSPPALHVAPTTRGGASDRGVADAGPWTRCCRRAVRLLVVVSYLLSIVEAVALLLRVPPLSRRPGLVQASWARTAAAFLERPVRVLVWSIASRGEGSRLVEVRVARRPRGALPIGLL